MGQPTMTGGYEAWLQVVLDHLHASGFTRMTLQTIDCPDTWALWDEGYSPAEAAEEVVRE